MCTTAHLPVHSCAHNKHKHVYDFLIAIFDDINIFLITHLMMPKEFAFIRALYQQNRMADTYDQHFYISTFPFMVLWGRIFNNKNFKKIE